MKKTITTLLALAVLIAMAVTFNSCKKDEPNQAPTITLEEPEDNSTVTLGNEIHVEGTAADDNELHEMAIWITYMGDTVDTEYPTVHGLKTYDFHKHYEPVAAGTYTVSVVVADHEELTATVVRTVTVQ